jgi:hypothetical protein
LKLLTIQQAIDDIEYFAKNVNLPMPGGDSVTPDKTPWILTGASYPGTFILLLVFLFRKPTSHNRRTDELDDGQVRTRPAFPR